MYSVFHFDVVYYARNILLATTNKVFIIAHALLLVLHCTFIAKYC